MNKFRIFITSILFILSACGGGENNTPGGSSPAIFASDVFVEPSGPLCSVRKSDPILQEDYCVEPTASSATPSQLLQALSNPSHPYIEFSGSGIRMTAKLNSILYEGLEQKHFLLHAEHVYDGEKIYNYYSPISDDHTRAYAFNPAGMTVLNRDSDPQVFRVSQNTPLTNPPPGVWFDQLAWSNYLGMRTDWLTAPTERTVRLLGFAVVTAGDGHYLGRTTATGNSSSHTRGQCPIEMELDAKFGNLTLKNSPTTCIDAETGAQMTLAISDLGLRSEASVIKRGVSESSVVASLVSAPEEVLLLNENITEISGGIYGERAKVVVVHGSSSNANFLLFVRRLD